MDRFFSPSKKFIVKKISSGYIFIPLEKFELDGVYSTNEVGYIIYSLVEKKYTFEKIVKFLCDKYNVKETHIREDVRNFLENMKKIGIIEERK